MEVRPPLGSLVLVLVGVATAQLQLIPTGAADLGKLINGELLGERKGSDRQCPGAT